MVLNANDFDTMTANDSLFGEKERAFANKTSLPLPSNDFTLFIKPQKQTVHNVFSLSQQELNTFTHWIKTEEKSNIMYKHYGACYVWREKQIKFLKRTESTVAKITEHPARDKSLGILILMLTQPTFRSHQRKERREFKPINKYLILL